MRNCKFRAENLFMQHNGQRYG